MMKRFYIKRVSNFVTIMHRPTHQIIMMGSMDSEMKNQIKKFIKMGTEEFYKELNSLGLKFKTGDSIIEERSKEDEEWYEKAWLHTTNQVLKHYKIELNSIPEEEVPLELIKELQKQKNSSWNINAKGDDKDAPEEQEEQEKPKKLPKKKAKKLPKKVSNKKVINLVPYNSKQEVRRAYSGGEIDLETYKKYMRALKS